MLIHDNKPHIDWRLAVIEDLIPDNDGVGLHTVRAVRELFSYTLVDTKGRNFGSPLLFHYTKYRSNKKEFKECAKTAGFRSAHHIL